MSAGRFASGGRGRATAFESDLIARLRVLPVGPKPDRRFKSELRAQLVAITARIVAESAGDVATAAGKSSALARRPAGAAVHTGRTTLRGAARALRRPILGLASAAAVLALMLGAALWMSSGSLPGDSLYGVKRASENLKLSVAGGDVDKGYTYLRFATTRADEVTKLLGKPSALAAGPGGAVAAGQPSSRTVSLVKDTLDSLDSDSRSGMQLLGKATVAQQSAAPLSKLQTWTVGQRAKLSSISSRLPAGDLRTRVQASLTLLKRIETRSAELKSKVGCACLSQTRSDDLGPVPCSPCKSLGASAPGSSPGSPGGSAPAGQSGSGGSSSNRSGAGTVPNGSGPAGGTGGTRTGGASGGINGGGVSVGNGVGPTTPGGATATPSLPITGGSDGLGTTLPHVSVGVGSGGVTAEVPLPSIHVPGLIHLN
ncbi:MAG: hypothetical protein QOE71_4153 [Pseudonocardiales bacterium]|jgi:hypothetical protein|nr:hypothetical protein [Pseudonocardiales bacterium]